MEPDLKIGRVKFYIDRHWTKVNCTSIGNHRVPPDLYTKPWWWVLFRTCVPSPMLTHSWGRHWWVYCRRGGWLFAIYVEKKHAQETQAKV